MLFKGMRVKVNTTTMLKNITPLSKHLNNQLLGIESSTYKLCNDVFRTAGFNESESAIGTMGIVATLARDQQSAIGDITEHTEVLHAIYQQVRETALTSHHITLDKFRCGMRALLVTMAEQRMVSYHGIEFSLILLDTYTMFPDQ